METSPTNAQPGQATLTDEIASPRPRNLLIWGVAALAFLTAMGISFLLTLPNAWTQPLDDAWRGIVGSSPQDSLPNSPLAMFFQQFGQPLGALFTLIIIPVALMIFGHWRSGLFVMAASFAGPGLVSQLAKNLVDRPRPATDEAAGLYGPLFTVDHGSFPSGHAVSMGVFVVVIMALIPAAKVGMRRIWLVIGLLLCAGMIWQRTLINAHWLSDSITGVIGGVGVGLIMWWAFWPLLKKDESRPWRIARTAK